MLRSPLKGGLPRTESPLRLEPLKREPTRHKPRLQVGLDQNSSILVQLQDGRSHSEHGLERTNSAFIWWYWADSRSRPAPQALAVT